MATYLSRTPASAGNRKIYLWSGWVKRSLVNGTQQDLMAVSNATNDFSLFYFDTNESLTLNLTDNGSSSGLITTNRKFRDVSAWYHIVLAVDTTQATASDRVKIYVNGVQETSFSSSTYPSQNYEGLINTGLRMDISGQGSAFSGGTNSFFGSMTHVHFIDGTVYDADDFGETDSTTGIWKPKTAPSVTYGTNGFFLKFENSGAFGTDSSGNSNTFTVNGTMTQTIDTPSNVFATLNPLARRITNNDPTYSNGNTSLQGQTVDGQNNNAIATLGDLAKGKYYFECKVGTVGSDFGVGISDTPDPSNGIPEGSYEVFYKYDGTKWTGSYTSYGATYTTGDIIGCAFDVTAGTVEFYKNGVSQGTAATDLATNLDHGYTPMGYTNQGLMHFNFGNGYFGTTAVSSAGTNAGIGTFEYDVPSGYKAVCTKNINAQEYS
jgi:hypothetical protein